MIRFALIAFVSLFPIDPAVAFPVNKPEVITIADLQEGDLLFQKSVSKQAVLIEEVTHSPWTHVALALRNKPDGPMMAFEAAGPVGFVSIDRLLARSRDGRLVVMRLRDRASLLTPARLVTLRTTLLKQKGKPYDPLFLWNDDAIYCSELVWKAYQSACDVEIGQPNGWSELGLQPGPARAELRKRYAQLQQPLDLGKLQKEKIIMPGTMRASPLLVEMGELGPKAGQ